MTQQTKKFQITFIGTGAMGKPMVRELMKNGYPVKIYDKYKSAAEALVEAGAVWADTPKESAVGSEIVFTCLPLPEHVYENMMGPNGALEGMHSGAIWVDTSTTDYHNTLRIAEEAKKKGVFSLESPVSNLSHMGADFANTSIYVGGEKEAYERVKDVLNVISKISFHVAKIGEAQTVKLITNLLFYTDTVICGECLAIAQEAGIPLQWMWEQINKSTALSVSTEQFMPFLFDHTYDNSCSLEIGHKDMNLTTSLADELKVALPLGRIIRDHYDETMRRWDSQKKHVIVCKVTEEDNDISMQIPDFVAPSKYGANPDFVRSGEMVTDEHGRIKPKLPDSYKADPFQPTDDQQSLIQTLIEYMTWINYVIYEECLDLGVAMGLSKELLAEVILWSVGTCWVTENYGKQRPDSMVLEKMAAIETKLKLMTSERVIGTFK
jgi:3-hydroxyisobutyrate dehydrogenase-like beta-hydroxyacid dehydrogenase